MAKLPEFSAISRTKRKSISNLISYVIPRKCRNPQQPDQPTAGAEGVNVFAIVRQISTCQVMWCVFLRTYQLPCVQCAGDGEQSVGGLIRGGGQKLEYLGLLTISFHISVLFMTNSKLKCMVAIVWIRLGY